VSGFFRRVSHYARPALSEQRENRLTEVFAGVLEHADGLALMLAREWLVARDGDKGGPECGSWSTTRAALAEADIGLRELRTQRFTRGGWFVDLELRFGRPYTSSAEDVVLWVEVKHGVSPHEHQLQNYLDDLLSLGARASAVILLAPRSSYPFTHPEEPPQEVPQRIWQRTAQQCRKWRPSDPVGQFLVNEFLDYLQRESLMDPEVVTPVHLIALAEYSRAHEGVALACQVATAFIDKHWNTRLARNETRGKENWGVGYWETHPQSGRDDAASAWGPAWFDWNLKDSDAAMEDSRGGVPVFMAGVSAYRPQLIVISEDAAWAAELQESHGFVSLHDDMERFAQP
jgi:hypothetical protein